MKVSLNNNKFVEVDSLKSASIICRNFIKNKSLRSTGWFGGKVYDELNNHIVNISYNSRCWEVGEYPTPEILIQ
jgi:hypothetical protein